TVCKIPFQYLYKENKIVAGIQQRLNLMHTSSLKRILRLCKPNVDVLTHYNTNNDLVKCINCRFRNTFYCCHTEIKIIYFNFLRGANSCRNLGMCNVFMDLCLDISRGPNMRCQKKLQYHILTFQVYRVSPTLPLRTNYFGEWTSMKGVIITSLTFYERRNRLDGL
ncbi:hypothetical protein L9F63_012765, partial [Diploptera punctata]